MKLKSKIVFVLGGVFSGIGKGIISSSIGKLLKNNGLKVSIQKHDPYLNVDCGLLSPIEHGEVFVTKDGLETDLDLGNYERFLNQEMSTISSITAGQIYQELLQEERNRKYQGKTINIFDVANKIREKILNIIDQEESDCLVVELGGTLGDNDLKPFLIAAAQLQRELPKNDIVFIYLIYVYYLEYLKQFKTKPAQNAISRLRNNGIEPDFIILRSSHDVDLTTKEKFAKLCYLSLDRMFAVSQTNIYLIPSLLTENGFFDRLIKHLALPNQLNLMKLNTFRNQIIKSQKTKNKIKLFVINKYLNFEQSYLSLYQALYVSAIHHHVNLEIIEIDPEKLNPNNLATTFSGCDGILVPGGFGSRGVEGKMLAVQFARQNQIPFLGVCLGFQIAIIEFARNVLHLSDANSEEFISHSTVSDHLVIHYLNAEHKEIIIGEKKVFIQPKTLMSELVKKSVVGQRFRNRLVFNNRYFLRFLRNNFVFSSFINIDDSQLVASFELPTHPYFVGVQSHLELNSWPEKPSPVIMGFIKSCKTYQHNK